MISFQYRKNLSVGDRVSIVVLGILIVGFALGIALDANPGIPSPWNRLSSIMGWLYFMCWSVSFYPQVFLNYQRKTVVGLSLDYTILNLLGFICYAVFNCCFYGSRTVQDSYKRRHNGHANAVELNDVLFSLHATVLISISMAQCVIYPRGEQKISRITLLWTIGALSSSTAFALAIAVTKNNERSFFSILNLLYLLSFIKLLTSLTKNIPQLILNYKRKSTLGWTIWNVLLDFAGGLLSILQLLLDSWATNDWTKVTGDPVKFALGFVSIVIDVIYIMQHYVLYKESSNIMEDEKSPLLLSVDLIPAS